MGLMILFTQSTAVLHKYSNEELKILCLLRFFSEVAQNSLSFPCSEKYLSIPGFPGLWPPCMTFGLTMYGFLEAVNSICDNTYLLRYWASKILGSRSWLLGLTTSSVTWPTDHWNGNMTYNVYLWPIVKFFQLLNLLWVDMSNTFSCPSFFSRNIDSFRLHPCNPINNSITLVPHNLNVGLTQNEVAECTKFFNFPKNNQVTGMNNRYFVQNRRCMTAIIPGGAKKHPEHSQVLCSSVMTQFLKFLHCCIQR